MIPSRKEHWCCTHPENSQLTNNSLWLCKKLCTRVFCMLCAHASIALVHYPYKLVCLIRVKFFIVAVAVTWSILDVSNIILDTSKNYWLIRYFVKFWHHLLKEGLFCIVFLFKKIITLYALAFINAASVIAIDFCLFELFLCQYSPWVQPFKSLMVCHWNVRVSCWWQMIHLIGNH